MLNDAVAYLTKALNKKDEDLTKALDVAKSMEGVSLVDSINSVFSLRDIENKIAYEKSKGETGPVETKLSNYEISRYIKRFNELYKEGLIRDTFSMRDYDSSRVGEFVYNILSADLIKEITEEAERYRTPTHREKYGWNSRTIDF